MAHRHFEKESKARLHVAIVLQKYFDAHFKINFFTF